MKKVQIDLKLGLAIVNLLAGFMYVGVKFFVPELLMEGGLSGAAKGYPGVMLLIFSILAMLFLVFNFGLFMKSSRESEPVLGSLVGMFAHGYSFFKIGAYYGVPSLILCLISSVLLFRKKK
ncbi:MAG: hypothetical protein ACRCST_15920 [Turicibacter sp.]